MRSKLVAVAIPLGTGGLEVSLYLTGRGNWSIV
jgi:hypothetical protein